MEFTKLLIIYFLKNNGICLPCFQEIERLRSEHLAEKRDLVEEFEKKLLEKGKEFEQAFADAYGKPVFMLYSDSVGPSIKTSVAA